MRCRQSGTAAIDRLPRSLLNVRFGCIAVVQPSAWNAAVDEELLDSGRASIACRRRYETRHGRHAALQRCTPQRRTVTRASVSNPRLSTSRPRWRLNPSQRNSRNNTQPIAWTAIATMRKRAAGSRLERPAGPTPRGAKPARARSSKTSSLPLRQTKVIWRG